jgi:hypothetical protein
MGVALAAAMLALLRPSHAGAGLTPADFMAVFLGMGFISILALPFFAALPRDAGKEVSRYRVAEGR